MSRRLVSSGSPLEPEIGFSRAVRVGGQIAVAGTAPIGSEEADTSGQTIRCLEITRAALDEAGASLSDMIRTRIMLTDIAEWKAAARAHGDVFGAIRPACTFVEVSGFIDPAWRVETEADAVLEEG